MSATLFLSAWVCLWGQRDHLVFFVQIASLRPPSVIACASLPFFMLVMWFFLPLYHFLPHSSEHYLFTLFHFASPLSIFPVWFPILSSPPWSFILSFSNSLSCLSVCALVTFIFPIIISHLSSLILSHPFLPPSVCSSPWLFSVSVEPLWLHRYSDCWLCRWGGMLFRHSTRRYCTSCTQPLTTKASALNIALYWINTVLWYTTGFHVGLGIKPLYVLVLTEMCPLGIEN